MKRLFGVKKTVEAPSLEETTGKVINYLRALISLFSLFAAAFLAFQFSLLESQSLF
jgi:hypothetical protein